MTTTPYRIIIEGVGMQNKGSQAMTVTAKTYLEQHIPGARCYVISDRPLRTRQLRELGIAVIEMPPCSQVHKFFSLLKTQVLRKWIPRPRREPPRLTRFPYDWCDAVVDVSGFASSDQHGVIQALGRLRDRLQPMGMGKPILNWSQSWGPFRNPILRFLTQWLLRSSPLVVAREQTSLNYIHELNLPESCQIIAAPDMAFHFKGGPPEDGLALLTELGRRPGESPIVGITPNLHVYWRTYGEGQKNEYIQHMVAVTRHFLDKGVQVVVMGHQIAADDSYPDDKIICRYIRDAVGKHPNLSVMLTDNNAATLKALIGQLDFLVTSRYHTIIAAFSLRVPVAAIGWSHKYDDLFQSVNLPQCQIPFHEATRDSILTTVETCWNEREQIKKVLAKNVPAVEEAAKYPLDLAVEILNKHRKSINA